MRHLGCLGFHRNCGRIAESLKRHGARGLEYLAITDHSRRLTIAKGLAQKRLFEQLEEIDRLNATLSGITLLNGIEVDILEDGSLDLPDEDPVPARSGGGGCP